MTDRNRKIEVRLLPRQNWAGNVLLDNCARVYYAPLDRNVRKPGYFRTELSLEEQEAIEAEMNLSPGELSNNSSYWETFSVRLTNKGDVLDLSKGSDFLNWKVLCANRKRIAIGEKEAKENPSAEFVLHDKEAEARMANTRRESKTKAYVIFSEMTPVQMREMLLLTGRQTGSVSDEVVRDMTGELIESDPAKFILLAGDKNFAQRVVAAQLKAHGVLVVDKGMWRYGDVNIGIGEESVVEFLKDKKNQETVLVWKRELADRISKRPR